MALVRGGEPQSDIEVPSANAIKSFTSVQLISET